MLTESIISGIALNIVSNLIWDNKLKRDDKRIIRDIHTRISDFNREFDNTAIDTYAFQQFIDSTELISEIYKKVFFSYLQEEESLEDVKNSIALQAIRNINEFYQKRGRSELKDSDICYDYFHELFEVLIQIRSNILSTAQSAQTSIITQEILKSKEEIIKYLTKEDNIFANPKLSKITELIDMQFYNDAEKEIIETLESQYLLSIEQREFLYYEKARLLFGKRKYDELEKVIERIKHLNENSKFIVEIKYLIACHNQDAKLYSVVMDKFREYKYSTEKILLKDAYFDIVAGNIDKALDILIHENNLLTELDEFHEAHFYYGLILIEQRLFQQAEEEFWAAYNIHKKIIYKYNGLVSEYNLIVNDSACLISRPVGINKVKKLIKELKDIAYIIENLPDDAHIFYWIFLISLTMIVNPHEALLEVGNIEDRFLDKPLIKSLQADIYIKNNLYQKARPILEEVWLDNPMNAINLFIIYKSENIWEEIIEKYNVLGNSDFKKNPTILAQYIYAKNEVLGYDSLKSDFEDFPSEYLNHPPYIANVLRIVLQNNDEDMFDKLQNKMMLAKDSIHLGTLRSISGILLQFNKFQEARSLIENRILEDETLMGLYVQSFPGIENDSSLMVATYEKVKILYQNSSKYKDLVKFKIRLELILKVTRKVIETLQEYKRLFGIDDFYMYYYVASKIDNNEYDGLEAEMQYLLSTNDCTFHLLVAILKSRQGFWDEAKRIALKALYLNYGNLTQEFLINYVSMYFHNSHLQNESVDLDEVSANSVVTLESKENIRTIAIHNNPNYIANHGENKFGYENYGTNDTVSLLLISHGKRGEFLTIEDNNYMVKDILNLYTAFFRYCLATLQSEFPKHEYFITASGSTPEELRAEMTAIMKKQNVSKDSQIELYNFKINCGMPISFLSGKNIDSYTNIITSLLNKKDQHLYAGEVTIFDNQEYVISLSSIILLSIFGLLEKLEQIKHKCTISNLVYKSIIEGIKESQIHAQIESGIVILTEEGEISGYSYTEEDKVRRKTFWTKILITITKIAKSDVEISDNSIYEFFAKYLLDEDISSIELSKKDNRIFVCDDLFIRNLHHEITGTTNTTNIFGLLVSEGLMTYEELLDLSIRLVHCNYLFPINVELLREYIMVALANNEIESRDKFLLKVKQIFNAMLDGISNSYYADIYKEFIKSFSEFGIPTGIVYKLVQEPLKLKPWGDYVNEKSREYIMKLFEEWNV